MPTPSQPDPALRKPCDPSTRFIVVPPSACPTGVLHPSLTPPYGPAPCPFLPHHLRSPALPSRPLHPPGEARQERGEGWTSAAAESVRPPRGEGPSSSLPSFRPYPPLPAPLLSPVPRPDPTQLFLRRPSLTNLPAERLQHPRLLLAPFAGGHGRRWGGAHRAANPGGERPDVSRALPRSPNCAGDCGGPCPAVVAPAKARAAQPRPPRAAPPTPLLSLVGNGEVGGAGAVEAEARRWRACASALLAPAPSRQLEQRKETFECGRSDAAGHFPPHHPPPHTLLRAQPASPPAEA